MNKNNFFPATRQNALKQAENFAPEMGSNYSSNRNIDRGLEGDSTVSKLSPYIRRRLMTEQELALLALETHGAKASGKFVQEIVWRTYWKGWLEHRPTVWNDYLQDVADERDRLSSNTGIHHAYQQAIEGRTGIECFDVWAQELVETNYLHNHARMSFASIWVHTLRLPWSLGAEFFFHHLLDGDAASNTLSWRWVAGAHTAGKTYLADPAIINRCSNGRFSPKRGELATEAEEIADVDLPDRESLRQGGTLRNGMKTALLLTDDDCHVEDLIGDQTFESITTFATSNLRTADGAAEAVVNFEREALADQTDRLQKLSHPPATTLKNATALTDWCAENDIQQLAVAIVPQGPTLDALKPAFAKLKERNIAVIELQRDWDALIWPHATAGFFKVKKQMPRFMQQLTSGHF
ncbi:FAD-binding domain-containing protein [Ahrensia sp. R2A130]|uniref:FAD-binding domain-containing protein n=1 Tax=Ahrensia sp. R2A130 TaxID=744979 RepID=UPI0001E0F837|nr:FAD-binding domain-containing protein [Ahrensia sp. R2A130]EFL90479.1 deoxyribodipyrimidine photo-lyase family protein [Ahrensia sp. R2A130]